MTRSAISVPLGCWFDTDEILGRQLHILVYVEHIWLMLSRTHSNLKIGASSTGRCNTIQCVDSTMPPREK
jgi:hypothetical protein